MVLADGARAEAFEGLLAAGELPNIRTHVVDRGSYRRATSVFTSTTGPAHLPLLTGCYPGTADIPGYRWFERRSYRPGLWLGQWCMRSYNGPESSLASSDLSPGASTLFELTANPLNVFGWTTRGLSPRNNLFRHHKSWLWLWSHYAHDYRTPDRWAARAMSQSLSISSEFRFIAFPGIDWNSHYISPEGPETEEAFRVVDRAVGDAAAALQRTGAYEETLILICSDHGHHPVHTHYDLPVRLERDFGMRVGYHSWPVFRRRPEAVCCVSGNGMAHTYLRAGDWKTPPDRGQIDAAHPGLRDGLLAEPAVDLLITRGEGERSFWVESRRGRARAEELPEGLAYRTEEGDPFGWEGMPERLSWEEALRLTFDTPYPDAIVQIAQLFRSTRSGDLIVSATPGYDLRERFERPEHFSSHGSLDRSHMLVPLAASAPLTEGPMRTADAFPTVLEYLGRDAPAGIDGVSRLA
jgi:type I phosphodiesterase/nucleotide pyrophosphatase